MDLLSTSGWLIGLCFKQAFGSADLCEFHQIMSKVTEYPWEPMRETPCPARIRSAVLPRINGWKISSPLLLRAMQRRTWRRLELHRVFKLMMSPENQVDGLLLRPLIGLWSRQRRTSRTSEPSRPTLFENRKTPLKPILTIKARFPSLWRCKIT